MAPHREPWVRTTLSFALVLGMLTGCAPTFDKGRKSQDEFDSDHAQCLQENSTKTSARYGPSRHTDWNEYARCMSSKGHSSR